MKRQESSKVIAGRKGGKMFSKRLLTLTQALSTLHTRARLQKCLGVVKGKNKNKNNKTKMREGGRMRVFGSVVCLGKVVKG